MYGVLAADRDRSRLSVKYGLSSSGIDVVLVDVAGVDILVSHHLLRRKHFVGGDFFLLCGLTMRGGTYTF